MALFDLLQARLVKPLEVGSHEAKTAEALLYDATVMVAEFCGWDIAKVEQWPHQAKIIVINAAKRVLTNPDGIKYEQIGPYAYSRDGDSASGSMWLTKAEEKWLAMTSGRMTVTSVEMERSRAPRAYVDRGARGR